MKERDDRDSSSPPLKVKVEITTRCNLRCPPCRRTQARPPIRDISMEIFRKVRKQLLPSAKAVFFSGLGEPTLHPSFAAICEEISIAKAHNTALYAFFVTNGTSLGPAVRRQILEAGFDEILVSLDSTTASTYQKVRPGGSIESVLENIGSLTAEKKAANQALRVILSYTLNAANLDEVSDFPELAARVDCDGIVVQNMMVYDRAAVDALLLPNGSAARFRVEEKIQAVARGALEHGLECKVPAPSWFEAVLRAEARRLDGSWVHRSISCRRPSKVLQLRLNGSISSCIGTEFMKVDLEHVDDLVEEIWESEAFARIRDNLARGVPDPHCARCALLHQIPMVTAEERLSGLAESPVEPLRGKGH